MFAEMPNVFWLNVRLISEKYRQIFNIKTENRPDIWYFDWITVFDCREEWWMWRLISFCYYHIVLNDFMGYWSKWDVIFSFIKKKKVLKDWIKILKRVVEIRLDVMKMCWVYTKNVWRMHDWLMKLIGWIVKRETVLVIFLSNPRAARFSELC